MSFQDFMRRVEKWRFTTAKQQGFLEDLSVLIGDGVPPNKAVDTLAGISTGITRKVAKSLARSISEGQPLAEGMEEFFGPNVAALVRAGEAGGALGDTVKAAAEELTKKSGALKSVIGIIMYPAVVNIMAWGVIVYINSSVFADFLKIKPLELWPPVGQDFVAYGNFLVYWWWSIFAILGGVYYGLLTILRLLIGPPRTLLDRFPIFKLYRQIASASFMETLGMLVSNGVVFKEALGIIRFSAPTYTKWHVSRMQDLLSQGFENIADVLNTGMIDEESIARLRIVAEAKGFDHALVRLGIRASEAAQSTIRKAAKMVSGLLLAAGGGQIAFIIKAIYTVGMSLGS